MAILQLLLYITIITCNGQSQREATIGYGGMAASAHYLATEAGIRVLKQCGSAADAAVAMQAVLTVVQPHKSGIGGGKFIMYYNHSNKQIYSLDAREEAPDQFHGKIFCKNPDCFLNSSCECDGTMTFAERRVGGLSVGVPGTIHGLYTLQKYFGSGAVAWTDLFTDAINVARNGFPMYHELYIDINDSADVLSRFEASKRIFLNNNNQPKVNVNETWFNPDLADTLEATSISPQTAIRLWYEGDIAEAIIQTAQNTQNEVEYNGNITYRKGLLTMEDMNGYRAIFREPSQSYYGNSEQPTYKMYGMNYPSSGSPSIQYLMNLMHSLINDETNPDSNTFGNNDNEMLYSGTNAHYMLSGNNIVFADRNQYMADMDFVDIPVDGLLNYSYINSRYKQYLLPQLNANNTPPIPYGIPPGTQTNTSQSNFGSIPEYGTSHYFVVDQWNNMACVTTTIEGNFGSGIVVPNYGFLLNNELTDFDVLGETSNGETVANGPAGGKKLRKTALNLFDLNDNETYGGKRPRSSMGPMIVVDADTNVPIIGVGSPGGSRIIATVFQILFNALIRNMDVQTAIDLPRIWASNSVATGSVMIEPEWYNNPNFVAEMELRGYDMDIFANGTQGRCHAVRYVERDEGDGDMDGFLLYGGADDSRWSTATVEAVFLYDEYGVNNEVIVCGTKGMTVTTLSDAERIILIVIWLIVLVFVCFCVVNRTRIKKWYTKGKIGYTEFSNEQHPHNKTDNSARL